MNENRCLDVNGLDVVLIDGFSSTTFRRNSLPERVKLYDARNEYGESHEGTTHGVDDDAFRDELHVLVANHFNSLHRLSVHCAGQFAFCAKTVRFEFEIRISLIK